MLVIDAPKPVRRRASATISDFCLSSFFMLLEELINRAKNELKNDFTSECLEEGLDFDRLKNIELLEQDIQRQKLLDPDLVAELAKAKAEGYCLWQRSRAENNFQTFAPALKNLIALRKVESSQLNESRSCWETLAQPYEPDLTIDRINELFSPLRFKLPNLINRIKDLKKTK